MTPAFFAQLIEDWKKRFEDAGALSSAALERTTDTDSDLEKEAEDFENTN